jgi:hypothetical protein
MVDTFLSICIGVGLSAACGFRVFVPLLCISVAAFTGHLHLASSFAWIGTLPALIAFAVATVVEIAAYYIPWVDNLLDAIAVPLAAVAGVVATAAVVADIDPLWKWTFAIIAGGGIATTAQIATTKARATSSVTTGGLANPVLATIENAISTVLSVVAVIWPVVALVLAVLVLTGCSLLIYYAAKALVKVFRQKPAEPSAVVR